MGAAGLVALAAHAPGASAAVRTPVERGVEGADQAASALDRAREESGVRRRPRSRFALPAGTLRVTSERLAAARQTIRLAVSLDRPVGDATVTFDLPALWLARAPGGLPYAKPPASGSQARGRARLGRRGRRTKIELRGARAGDEPALEVRDVGIPAGTYSIPYRWRAADGRVLAAGTVRVVLYAPSRETHGASAFSPLRGNVTANGSAEDSETSIATTPGNSARVVVGVNSDLGFAAYVSGNGGQTWVRRAMPGIMDAPGATANEASDNCCDPMEAADTLGNVWYGGLTNVDFTSSGPSRIVVNRIAAGTDTLRSVSTGLPVRPDGAGLQDKPEMTIDNTPSSPTFGRLYVVWDEPRSDGGVDLVITQCDTRPGGVANAANCDNSDNWSSPVNVTPPGEGTYIFGDVAVGPDSRVYVTWWDYSSNNGIFGDVCDPRAQNCASAASWGSPGTVAQLDATGGNPVPFACPILAQPGGRASPSPQLDVSHAGTTGGRVYVTWGDLRPGSGSTRCSEDPITGDGTPPLPTHMTWDSFVASAPGGALPGGASPSTAVGTRLLGDGEGGGQVNSDDWFPWLSVDQTTGQAVADFYSTRDDSSRNTTNFFVRTVTPSGGGQTLGTLTRVSTAPSDYSANQDSPDALPCCDFANNYGDYEGLDATQTVAYPVWTDNSTAAGGDGEAFTAAVSVAPPPPPPGSGGGSGGGGSTTGSPGGPSAPAGSDTRRPRLRLALSRRGNRVLRQRGLVLLFRPDEAVRATFSLSVSVPGASRTFRLRRVTRSFAANRRVKIKLRISRRVLRAVSSALRGHRRVRAAVTVSGLDGAGNRGSARLRVRLRR